MKPDLRCKQGADHKMPPTRGHDLKPHLLLGIPLFFDAPHTGARLETYRRQLCPPKTPMPPTRGHDLKRPVLLYVASK